ncbi:membrane protein [Lentibacillus populi]|uniref:Membrane protein n=1 Tax=Lentibacillus populi TaxID=1827502 RepID=A0A9W5U026_9BACI|nr:MULTISPECIES: PDZ domain-containing protein [Bacillaceae]MBT2216117.1 PDZ domain-containing protein [Virgibacillus dakarensis]GGB53779.1 membrane protein [Lentibacillus populi]
MIEAWLMELAKGIGKLFLNPLLYWAIIIVVLSGMARIKKERMNFGTKVFDVFSECKNTWLVSLVTGISLSVLVLGIGIAFSYETIFLLSIVTIVLGLGLRLNLLSPSYTIGFTYFLLLFIPYFLEKQTYINLDTDLLTEANFTGLVILLGLLLLVEAVLVLRVKRNESFPDLVLGNRGKWVGQHHIKKLSVIPFFVLVPSGLITTFAPFWPYFSLGGDTYSLLLVPFLLGFDHVVRGHAPYQVRRKLANSIGTLGVLVLLFAAGSVFVSWLSLAAVIIAVLGREYIGYRHRIHDKENIPYFHGSGKGLKVLAIIPDTPADRLGILIGETIHKVNGKKVNDVAEFYHALQASGAFFKLEVVDDSGEVRFIKSALYQGDHHELGIVFTKEKYRNGERKWKEKAELN